ncbi:hypothetical protein QF030_006064 [Streptomyces rishiriensis]|uniref:Uncharacterized protein n=1 Tax=Streptomyces rishiriensis TaxID=68264 RepID=A0ABU0NXL5_STRRH|nr:hypothetical protein [Streptomyces rishiriensis]
MDRAGGGRRGWSRQCHGDAAGAVPAYDRSREPQGGEIPQRPQTWQEPYETNEMYETYEANQTNEKGETDETRLSAE